MSLLITLKQVISILLNISKEGKPLIRIMSLSISAFISEIILLTSIGILLRPERELFIGRGFLLFNNANFLIITIILCSLFRILINFNVVRFTHFFGSKIGEGIAKNKFFQFDILNNGDHISNNAFITILVNHTITFVSCLQNLFMGIIGIFTALSICLFLYIEKSYLSIYVITLIGLLYIVLSSLTNKSLKIFSKEVALNQKNLVGIGKEGLLISKELYVGNRQNFVIEKIAKIQTRLMRKLGNSSFLIVLPKYGIEALLFSSFAFFILNESLTNNLLIQLPILVIAALKIIPSFQSIYSAISTLRILADSINEVHKGLIIDKPQSKLLQKENSNNFIDPILIFRREKYDICSKNSKSIQKNKIGNLENKNSSNLISDIKMGSTVCLYGQSGSGKTTFIQSLILNTLINLNLNIKNKNNHFKVEFIDNKPNFISGTVLENLKQGQNQINLKLVEELLLTLKLCKRRSEIPSFLNLYLGDSSKIKLSGGEEQRLSLIRALCREPDYLFADEFTAALDSELELVAFNQAILYSKNLIFISHSKQLIKKADYQLRFPINL